MYGGQRGFMLTMVRDELRRAGFDDQQIDSGGLRVETTFTRKAMAAAENGVLEERPAGPEEAARRDGIHRRAERWP